MRCASRGSTSLRRIPSRVLGARVRAVSVRLPCCCYWVAFCMEPTREDVDALPGVTLLEFGASWCGFCIGARSMIDELVADHSELRHIRIEDGKGKRLG